MRIRVAISWAALTIAVLPGRSEARIVTVPSGDGQSGFGYIEPSKEPCVAPEERAAIRKEVARARAMLEAQGRLQVDSSQIVLFDWPLRATGDTALDPGFHALTNHVDQDPAVGALLDHECGTRVYDGHGGTDIIVWPFTWLRFDAGDIEVVAAAPGTILSKSDGAFDERCSAAALPANTVFVQHADGSVAWYYHLQNGSLTTKPVGATIATGEYIGLVGSSGSSTEPHLHFEVHDVSGNRIDPYSGPCNSMNATSWWLSQPPYLDSRINKMMTGTAPAVFPACPGRETTNEAYAFHRGDLVYFTVFYRDQVVGQVTDFRIRDAVGSTFTSWTRTSPGTYAASWWIYNWFMPTSGYVDGVWTFEADYDGNTYVQEFGVDLPTGVTVAGAASTTRVQLLPNHPNPFVGSTSLPFVLPRATHVELTTYDVRGARVATLVDGIMAAGPHTARWNGIAVSGEPAPAGVYFYRLRADGETRTRRMTLQR